MIKKEFLNLSQSLSSDKNGYQGIWKFWVNGKGGAKGFEIRPYGPPYGIDFFQKLFVTIPRRFQMIKKEFLNLNQSLSSDKNGYQGIWKFWVNGKGGPKDLKSGPMVPHLVSIFFKCCL